jgi:hypothetical protein
MESKSMIGEGIIADEASIEILMKKYALLREEVLFHFKNAKLHIKHFQWFIAGCVAIGVYLIFPTDSRQVNGVITVIGITTDDLFLYVVWALSVLSYYFAFDILDSYFCMFLAGARLANIEEQIIMPSSEGY